MKRDTIIRSLSLPLKAMRLSLFGQMLMTIGLLLLLAMGTIWLYLSNNLQQLLQQQTDTFAHTISQQAALSSAELVMAEDALALTSMLDSLAANNDTILYLAVRDHENQLLAQSPAKPPTLAHSHNRYFSPILFHDVQAGQLELALNTHAIRQSLIESHYTVGIITLVVAMLALALAVGLARRLTAPIKSLRQVANKVAHGDLAPELPQANNDELGDLIRSFDGMLQGLRDKESIEHKFSSYISKDIANDILANLSQPKTPLKSVQGSVLFVDIVGFTQLCEQHPTDQIAEILNQYYFLLHQSAKMYRGSVDNYIGDGAMLTFGIHKADQKHSINAVCAAQIFIRLGEMMNAQRKAQGKITVEFRLGLHCGEILAGTIGSHERMQSTICGDSVNLAARLCDQAHPGTLLLSESIAQQPSTKDLLILAEAQSLKVKGKSRMVKAYGLIGLAPKFNRLLMQQEAEMKAMTHHG